jgi:hypothetical protein
LEDLQSKGVTFELAAIEPERVEATLSDKVAQLPVLWQGIYDTIQLICKDYKKEGENDGTIKES